MNPVHSGAVASFTERMSRAIRLYDLGMWLFRHRVLLKWLLT